MKTEPDIYAENPVITPEYLIAVIQAAQTEMPVQYRIIGSVNWPNPGVRSNGSIGWDWMHYQYRIDPACKPQPPKIAEGNNPDKLTEDQVGVKDGWRLVTKEEISHRLVSNSQETTDAFLYSTAERQWNSNYSVEMKSLTNTYRTKKPAGFFLPKPKVKVPLTIKEYTSPTIWLRSHLAPGEERSVVAVMASSGVLVDALARWHTTELLASGWEYSTDRVNWKPCYKEVEQ